MTTQTATTTDTRRRQPKGVATGGQFAIELRGEAPTSLGVRTDQAEGRDRTRIQPRSRSELMNILPPLSYNLDDETELKKWIEAADQASRFYSRHYGTERRSNVNDADDVAQNTMLAVISQYERFKVGEAEAPQYPRNYLVSIAANKSVQATADGKRFDAENRRANRLLQDEVEKIEKEHGRSATRLERDALKEKVLREWHDPQRKPSPDFDKTQERAVSLDRPVGGEDSSTTLGQLLKGRDTMENDIAAASFMDHVFQDKESRGAKAVERRKRQAWNAIAERTGAPWARGGTLSQDQVDAHKEAITSSPGGVRQAIRDYNAGELNPAVEALTAPFGDLKARAEQDAVDGLADFTGGYPDKQANEMFALVLDAAGPEGVKDMNDYAKETQKVLRGEDSATKRARKAAGIA